MNGHSDKSNPNTRGKVVYPKSGEPSSGVGKDGKPTRNTNPAIYMKTSQYGYELPTDPNWDKNSNELHLGTHNTPLVAGDGGSAAITKSAAKALGVKRGDYVKITWKDGKTQIRKIVDVTSRRIKDKRVDLFYPGNPENPGAQDPDIPDHGTVQKTTPP
jgi:hypothetical protein